MPKKGEIINPDRLRAEFARLGPEVYSIYAPPSGDLTYWTIDEALQSQGHLIREAERTRGHGPYPDLTRWPLLEDGEFLMVYNIETETARLLNDRDLEYIGDWYHLNPSGLRRWYLNRKSEDEFLVSDGNGLNVWKP